MYVRMPRHVMFLLYVSNMTNTSPWSPDSTSSTKHSSCRFQSLYQHREQSLHICLLDLSAAFDTVEHEIMFGRLESFGIGGCNIRWFKSYLVGRRQFVCTSSSSSLTAIVCGVSQGSVL